MNGWERLAEQRIREAIDAGEFDDLPGLGQPLPREDLSSVPPELRMAYGMLRRAGALPEEVELQRRITTLGDLLRACDDGDEEHILRVELREAQLRYEMLMDRLRGNSAARRYGTRVRRRMGL